LRGRGQGEARARRVSWKRKLTVSHGHVTERKKEPFASPGERESSSWWWLDARSGCESGVEMGRRGRRIGQAGGVERRGNLSREPGWERLSQSQHVCH
jgi:hypothetical protein